MWGEGAEWEAGCALINMQVTISPRACKCSDRALVVISLHALARRYERAQDNSDSATLRDMAAVMWGWFVESDLSRDVSVAIAGAPGSAAWSISRTGGRQRSAPNLDRDA